MGCSPRIQGQNTDAVWLDDGSCTSAHRHVSALDLASWVGRAAQQAWPGVLIRCPSTVQIGTARGSVSGYCQWRPGEWCTDPGERVAAEIGDGHRVILRVICENR